MKRPALLTALLLPATAAAGIADDSYPVLSFLLNNLGFSCAQVATISGVHLGYDCTLTPAQVGLTGDQCVAALQSACEPQVAEELTSAEVQAVVDLQCLTSCHSGPSPSDGLNLEDINDVVGVGSKDLPGMALIEPGDTGSSYIWHKINDTHLIVGGAGNRMPSEPFGNPAVPLTGEELATFQDWITAGAPE